MIKVGRKHSLRLKFETRDSFFYFQTKKKKDTLMWDREKGYRSKEIGERVS